jgi:hypothetical protein
MALHTARLPLCICPQKQQVAPAVQFLLKWLDSWLQASQLTMVPTVPVAAGSRLIAPGRLFARLPQNLAPFAYEVGPQPSLGS